MFHPEMLRKDTLQIHPLCLRSGASASCQTSTWAHTYSGPHHLTPQSALPLALTAALFTAAQTKKQHKCPWTDEWMRRGGSYARGHYAAVEKNVIMPFAATWMVLRDYHTQRRKSEKGKHHTPMAYGEI